MHQSDVLVIGGGPAGLATAFWQQRQNPQATVRVLEASSRAGGWIRSERHDGYLCERGPQGLRPDDDFDELSAALGLADRIVPADPRATRRWIARDGRLLPTPSGPLSLLTSPLLSLRGKLRLLREGRVPAGNGDRGQWTVGGGGGGVGVARCGACQKYLQSNGHFFHC